SSSRSKRSSFSLSAAAKVGSSPSFGGSQLPISWRRSPLRYASRNSSGRRPLAASQFSLPSTVPGRSAEGESGGGSHLATRNGASDIMTRRPATTLDVIYSLSTEIDPTGRKTSSRGSLGDPYPDARVAVNADTTLEQPIG